MGKGWFSVPTRLYLSAEEREKVLRMIQEQGIELGDLLADLLRKYLAQQEESASTTSSPIDAEGQASAGDPQSLAELEGNIRKLRDEIEHLRERAARLDEQQRADWLQGYIEDMEQEIKRMEDSYRARIASGNPTKQ